MNKSRNSAGTKIQTRNILIALQLANMPGQRKLSGIYAHVGARSNWNIRIFRTRQEVESPEFAQLIEGPLDGIIYSSAYSRTIFEKLAKVRCPLVCMEHAPQLLSRRKGRLVVIRNDSRSIARAALETFSHHGRYASYAFVHDREENDWSYAREKAFRHVLPKDFPLYGYKPLKSAKGGNDARALAGFLSKLPKPAAILAAHDSRAVDVIQAASLARLAVPDDIAVLGIDNDQFVCDSSRVPLSSIEPDHYAEGLAAARELDEMMGGRSHGRARTIDFGVRQVVVRSSTKNIMPMGSLVSRANDYIAEHACEGIAPSDVAHALGVSLPLLYLRLKQSKSPSIARMITQRKLKHVMQLLRNTDTSISAIPTLAGFHNANALKNLFKRETGMSMREFRRSSPSRSRGDAPSPRKHPQQRTR